MFVMHHEICCVPHGFAASKTKGKAEVFLVILRQVTDFLPAHHESAPGRSRCDGGAWPCPHYDLPGQTGVSES